MKSVPEVEVFENPSKLDINICIAHTKSVMDDYAPIAPSFARIVDNLYIGNVGAAAQTYLGTLKRFGGIFSAIGWERYGANPKFGYSATTGYSNLGVEYGTAFDERLGTTLVDRKFRTCKFVAEQRWPEERVARGDMPTKPYIEFVYNGKKYVIYPTDLTLDTKNVFVALMYLAADRIEQLLSRGGGDVLVHCREGRNRSAACIAAYLILKRGYSDTDAKNLIREANKNERKIPARKTLDNRSFCAALKEIYTWKKTTNVRYVSEVAAADVECVSDTYDEIKRLGMRYRRTWPDVNAELVGCEDESEDESKSPNDGGRCVRCSLSDEPGILAFGTESNVTTMCSKCSCDDSVVNSK
jgi:hypothetical protein